MAIAKLLRRNSSQVSHSTIDRRMQRNCEAAFITCDISTRYDLSIGVLRFSYLVRYGARILVRRSGRSTENPRRTLQEFANRNESEFSYSVLVYFSLCMLHSTLDKYVSIPRMMERDLSPFSGNISRARVANIKRDLHSEGAEKTNNGSFTQAHVSHAHAHE